MSARGSSTAPEARLRSVAAATLKARVAEVAAREEKREEKHGVGCEDEDYNFEVKDHTGSKGSAAAAASNAAATAANGYYYAPYGYVVSPSGDLVPMSPQEAAFYSQATGGHQLASPEKQVTQQLQLQMQMFQRQQQEAQQAAMIYQLHFPATIAADTRIDAANTAGSVSMMPYAPQQHHYYQHPPPLYHHHYQQLGNHAHEGNSHNFRGRNSPGGKGAKRRPITRKSSEAGGGKSEQGNDSSRARQTKKSVDTVAASLSITGSEKRASQKKSSRGLLTYQNGVFVHRYHKTVMCTNLKKHGSCRFGDKCAFAHSKSELRPRKQVARQVRSLEKQKGNTDNQTTSKSSNVKNITSNNNNNETGGRHDPTCSEMDINDAQVVNNNDADYPSLSTKAERPIARVQHSSSKKNRNLET